VLILFDHGTPKGLPGALSGHAVHTAQARGWDTLSNGALLNAAEEAGFELLLTTDRRIRYQQNLRVRASHSSFWRAAPSGPASASMPTSSLPSLLPRRLAVTPKSRFPSNRNSVETESKRFDPCLRERLVGFATGLYLEPQASTPFVVRRIRISFEEDVGSDIRLERQVWNDGLHGSGHTCHNLSDVQRLAPFCSAHTRRSALSEH
jgi:hypothetical protein